MPKPTQLERAVADFTTAMVAQDDEAGVKAVASILLAGFGLLERIAVALERAHPAEL